MKKKIYFSKLNFITILLIGIVALGLITFQQYQSKHSTLHLLMENQANSMDNHVKEELQQAYVLRGLVIGAKGGNVDLSMIGPDLELDEDVRNVLLAPNGIASDVYPLKGNEGVLGLDLYSNKNASSKDAKNAKESGQLTVTGPYPLVQGGLAISGRVEVQIPTKEGLKDWGLVSITLKFPEVMENTVTNDLKEKGYAYRVVKKDEKSGKATELLNWDFSDGNDGEILDFSIQGMEFQMEAYPIKGWFNYWVIILEIVGIILFSAIVSILITMITKRRKILHEQATKDALTGLYNRNHGKKLISKEILSKTNNQGVFLLLDLDHFKSVNDTLGHQAGDDLLIETAQILKKCCRSSDIVCRLGGDEFIMYLTSSSQDFLPNKLELIRSSLERNVNGINQSVNVSSSIGVAISPKDGSDFDTLYRNADSALYCAKENGRNGYAYYEKEKE